MLGDSHFMPCHCSKELSSTTNSRARATKLPHVRGKNERNSSVLFCWVFPGATSPLRCPHPLGPRDYFFQASVAAAKSDAERAKREFTARRNAEHQNISDSLCGQLALLQKELAASKSKAATDISRAQVRVLVQ